MGMTPGRTVRKGDSPQRYTPRAGSRLPGQVRRALDGHIESSQRNGESLEVSASGRLEVRAAKGGGLTQTKRGLVVDPVAVGDKNHSAMSRTAVPTTVSAAALHAWATALVSELHRTGRMRT